MALQKSLASRGASTDEYTAYQNAAPYFDLVRGALGDLVDGKHFFDIITDDIVYEVLYDVPGWPRVIRGRTDLMAAFRGYVGNIALQSADELVVHTTDDGCVVVIEYEVHGTIVATGVKYDNGFIQPSGGGKDVFVHITAVEQAGLRSLNDGQAVEYEIESNRGKEFAVNLKVG